uniref:Putative tail protein n=1 Tax=viral metagenome TaxID=1070528 RepID=A0A6M3JUE6_9ZZZZ
MNRLNMRRLIASNVGDLRIYGAATGGAVGYIADTVNIYAGIENDINAGWVNFTKTATNYEARFKSVDSLNQRIYVSPAFTSAPVSTNNYEVLAQRKAYYDNLINEAIKVAMGKFLLDNVDESLIMNPEQYEYTLPSSLDYISAIYMDSTGKDTDADMVTNGSFASDTGWTKGTGWTIASGVATFAAGTASNLEQDVSAIASRIYQIVFTLTRTAGSITPQIGSKDGYSETDDGTHTQYIKATDTGNFQIQATADFAGTIDNVTVKEISGETRFNTKLFNRWWLLTPDNKVSFVSSAVTPYSGRQVRIVGQYEHPALSDDSTDCAVDSAFIISWVTSEIIFQREISSPSEARTRVAELYRNSALYQLNKRAQNLAPDSRRRLT